MTCNILTPGHIKVLEQLVSEIDNEVVVGLITSRGLKGYKKEITPFNDRRYILEVIAQALGYIEVVAQDSLDPTENIKKYKCDSLASGDGFEEVELQAIKKLGLKKINIKLKGEKKKQYSSSKILCAA